MLEERQMRVFVVFGNFVAVGKREINCCITSSCGFVETLEKGRAQPADQICVAKSQRFYMAKKVSRVKTLKGI